MKEFEKVTSAEKVQVSAGFAWVTFVSLTLVSLVVGRSVMSEKGSIDILDNEVEWDDSSRNEAALENGEKPSILPFANFF